ncbi:MAG: alpha/beta fold hydrolase [Myxococcales bacterium]|nr:alpha/beta fold hydrolase [Myxococcales bacterium]
MAKISINGCELYYEDSGGHDKPVVVLSHGLLWSSAMFQAQVEALSDRYRVICYDHRGQGRSAVPRGRVVTIEACYRDAVALIEALNLGPCHFGGLSMGGFVAMRIAARRPDLLRSCVLMETSADPEPLENVGPYRRLNLVARWIGLRLVADKVMPIMFGRSFMTDPQRGAERELWRGRLMANRRSIYKAVNGVIERAGVYHELRRIELPTLIIVGDEDTATTPEKSRRLHEAISGSKLVLIEGAGHTSSVEQPVSVSFALRQFLDEVEDAREREASDGDGPERRADT